MWFLRRKREYYHFVPPSLVVDFLDWTDDVEHRCVVDQHICVAVFALDFLKERCHTLWVRDVGGYAQSLDLWKLLGEIGGNFVQLLCIPRYQDDGLWTCRCE